jgi:NADP-dependent 3-hydroxy acid dehydrogenase YdfG
MTTTCITGATAGFGEAIARKLAERKHRIIITGRRAERLEKLRNELKGLTEVYPLAFDVRERTSVEHAFASLPDEWKWVDVLVNNAGLALGKSFLDEGSPDDWDQMMDTNVKGLLYVTQALLPSIKKSEQGHIINIGSIAGKEVYPGGNVYCASKHAVDALSKAMRMELLADGVKVSQIRPGLADTEFSIVRYKGDRVQAEKVYQGYQALLAEDIARAVEFVLYQPEHVCINDLEITPTAQANAYLLEKDK